MKSTSRFAKLCSSSGSSIIESLVAAGIILIAASGLSIAFQRMAKAKAKLQLVTFAMNLESSLQAKIQDKNSFLPISSQLSAGNPAGIDTLTLPLQVPIGTLIKTYTVPIGSDVYFDKKTNLCTSCSTGTNWALRLRIEGQKKPGTTFPVYALAYRIDYNSELAELSSIGTQTATGFVPTDFKWPLPPEAYINQTMVPCNLANKEVFITGIKKDTGEVTCMPMNQSYSCAANEVAIGWQVVGGALQLKCQALAVATTPGLNYAVQNFNPSAGTVISGTSVVVTDSPWPLQTASGYTPPYSGRSVVGNICPPNYSFSGTCTAVSVTSWPGYKNVGCPPGYTGGPIWSPFAPTGVGTIANTSSGQAVNCSLSNPVQSVGSGYDAGWDAIINVNGVCLLSIPETVPL
jgi:type II secretory pathway pseudopilin PulG